MAEPTPAPPPRGRVRADGRTAPSRQFRRLCKSFTDDLGIEPTTAQTELVRQAALLVVRAGQLQQTLLAGESVDDDLLVRLTNAAVRALSALGVQHKRKASAPDLRKYLANKSSTT